MNKLINRNKLLFGCLAVMFLLPVSNLLADEWIHDLGYFSGSSGNDSGYSGYYQYAWEYAGNVDPSVIENSDGFEYNDNICAYSDVDVWAYEIREFEFDIEAYAGTGVYDTVSWDGLPGTSPGAEVSFNIDVDAHHFTEVACYGRDGSSSTAEGGNISKILFGRYNYSWGGWRCYRSLAIDFSSSGELLMDLGFYEIDNSHGEPSIISEIDGTIDEYTRYEYENSFYWEYDATVIYLIPSSISYFQMALLAECQASSYAYVNYEGAYFSYWIPEAWSIQEARIEIEAECSVE